MLEAVKNKSSSSRKILDEKTMDSVDEAKNDHNENEAWKIRNTDYTADTVINTAKEDIHHHCQHY